MQRGREAVSRGRKASLPPLLLLLLLALAYLSISSPASIRCFHTFSTSWAEKSTWTGSSAPAAAKDESGRWLGGAAKKQTTTTAGKSTGGGTGRKGRQAGQAGRQACKP